MSTKTATRQNPVTGLSKVSGTTPKTPRLLDAHETVLVMLYRALSVEMRHGLDLLLWEAWTNPVSAEEGKAAEARRQAAKDDLHCGSMNASALIEFTEHYARKAVRR